MLLVAFAALVATQALVADARSESTPLQQSQHHNFKVSVIVEGVEHPWGMAFLPGGDMLITERPGRLRHVRDGRLVETPVAGLPELHAERQGGLLDVVLHPQFAQNQFVYLTYSKRCDDGRDLTTAVGRGVWADGALEKFEELYSADACAPGGRHHGSRLVFDRDGYLFMTIGDRGVQERAQDPTDNVGVTLRLHDDGRIPDDNPFVGARGHDANWTYGNRNAQGMALHPETGEIWQNEHGPRGGDEVNVVQRGANYGWPAATLGINYDGSVISRRGHEQVGATMPVHHWTPSIAPSGMAFYSGDAFPGWRNDVFVGALSHQHLARLRFDGNVLVEEEKLLDRTVGRVRDVRVGPDGFIYLLTDDRLGKLIRLEPANRD